MWPEDLSFRYPRLFDLADAGAESGIRRHGLLLTLANRHFQKTEIAPINARRHPLQTGPSGTLHLHADAWVTYAPWQRLRGMKRPDRIKEVTALGGIPDTSRFIIDSYTLCGEHSSLNPFGD